MRFKAFPDIIEPGWYINVSFMDDAETPPTEMDFRYKTNGHPQLVELCDDGEWRSETGHGLTLEQPDFFNDRDYFLGPIHFEQERQLQ